MRITRSIPSPAGDLMLVGDGRALSGLYFTGHRPAPRIDGPAESDDGAFADAVAQLQEWFDGRRRDFRLELDVSGTDFQRRIWSVLVDIPYGSTSTYGEVAAAAGRPGAARAVGHAVARNPVAIVVPCHRVVGAGGVLGGFAGGTDVKRLLLDHESRSGVTFSGQGTEK